MLAKPVFWTILNHSGAESTLNTSYIKAQCYIMIYPWLWWAFLSFNISSYN